MGDTVYIDRLEQRRLLSTATLASGILTITGTEAKNTISMRFNAAMNKTIVSASDAGGPTTDIGAFTPSLIKRINVSTLGGDDFLVTGAIQPASVPLFVDMGAGNDTASITNNGPSTVKGGLGNDDLRGGAGNDSIDGGDGIDSLEGRAGNDIVVGGAGNDALQGGVGNDVLDGGLGADQIRGGEGTDTVTYASRTAAVTVDLTDAVAEVADDGQVGEKDFDHADIENVIGGAGADELTGSTLVGPIFVGFSRNNKLVGGGGADILNGLDGNDVLDGGLGKDVMIGGAGIDTADYSSPPDALKITLDGLANDGATGENDLISADIENANGGGGADQITGNAGANALTGNGGNDIIHGGAGNDVL